MDLNSILQQLAQYDWVKRFLPNSYLGQMAMDYYHQNPLPRGIYSDTPNKNFYSNEPQIPNAFGAQWRNSPQPFMDMNSIPQQMPTTMDKNYWPPLDPQRWRKKITM